MENTAVLEKPVKKYEYSLLSHSEEWFDFFADDPEEAKKKSLKCPSLIIEEGLPEEIGVKEIFKKPEGRYAVDMLKKGMIEEGRELSFVVEGSHSVSEAIFQGTEDIEGFSWLILIKNGIKFFADAYNTIITHVNKWPIQPKPEDDYTNELPQLR